MASSLLKVEGLTIASGQHSIVTNLSFHIEPGEIVALTGRSGSGKTSIALALLDLLPSGLQVTGGSISWSAADQPIQVLPQDHHTWRDLRGRHIGYTQQDVFGAFDPVMKMGDQMLMLIHERVISPNPEAEKELRIKMEEVGLHDLDRLWSSYPHQLSGGQLQRCQIAMAILIRPELLISDEPTSAIDKINQLELLDVFSMLKSRYKMAILCITHEEAVVRHLADREVRLDKLDAEFPLPKGGGSHAFSSRDEPILEVKGLAYKHVYGGMLHKKGAVVGQLDFSIRKGKCMGVVGESGSGKSTLAHLLVGLHTPMHGQIILDSKPVDFRSAKDVERLRSSVQLVMQDGRGTLHPNKPIRILLDEIGRIRKKSDSNFTYDLKEVLNGVGLDEGMLDRRAGQLSGGECLRVSIARALLMQPEVLICDESTSSLDGHARDAIINLLLHLKQERNLALIFISHDERIIRGIADEIMVLADGQVVEKGDAAALINYPTHPVTKKIFTLHASLEQRKASLE